VQGARQDPRSVWNSSGRSFCLGAYLGRKPVLHEDGQQVRDCVDARDVADAHVLVLHDPRADFQILNVGSGRPVTVSALARTVADVFDRRDWQLCPTGRHRPGDRRHLCADIRKLQALGWRPRRTLYDSLEAAKAWLIDAGVPDDIALAASPHLSLRERTPCPAATF
jgi:dTDP-L-rhamnose 4-epimerase